MQQHTGQAGDAKRGCGVLSQAETARRSGSRGALRAMICAALLLVGVAGFAGCSSDDTNNATGSGGSGGSGGTGGSGGSGGMEDDSGTVACSARTDVDTYTANMTKKGKSGGYTFLLVQSDPGPPAKNKNVWKVKVTDANGMPVSKNLTVEISMPEHKHNTSMPPKLTYDAASGTWTIDPVFLQMGGKWSILFEVREPQDAGGLLIDSAEFFFCVEG